MEFLSAYQTSEIRKKYPDDADFETVIDSRRWKILYDSVFRVGGCWYCNRLQIPTNGVRKRNRQVLTKKYDPLGHMTVVNQKSIYMDTTNISIKF